MAKTNNKRNKDKKHLEPLRDKSGPYGRRNATGRAVTHSGSGMRTRKGRKKDK